MRQNTHHHSAIMVYTGLPILSLVFVCYATLAPFNFDWNHSDIAANLLKGTRHVLTSDVLHNLLFYIPSGALFALLCYKGLKQCLFCTLIYTLFWAGIFSLSLEIVQHYVPGRHPSFLDVLLNMLSAIIGALLALLISSHYAKKTQPILRAKALQSPLNWLLIVGVVVFILYELYPYIPSLEYNNLLAQYHGWLEDSERALSITLLAYYIAAMAVIAWLCFSVLINGYAWLLSTLSFVVFGLAKISIKETYMPVEMSIAMAIVFIIATLISSIRWLWAK